MSCQKHFLTFRWEQHDWDRLVTRTERSHVAGTDQWGRTVPVDQVLCHTQFVCRTCGTVRDVSVCTCDPERAETCAVRLARLAEDRGQQRAAHA